VDGKRNWAGGYYKQPPGHWRGGKEKGRNFSPKEDCEHTNPPGVGGGGAVYPLSGSE
jgi:hypothetical protein